MAEYKRLVCSFTDPRGLEDSIGFWSQTFGMNVLRNGELYEGIDLIDHTSMPIGAQIALRGKFCDRGDKDPCSRKRELRAFRDAGLCKNLGYLSKYVFTFDTSDLNTKGESNGEFYSDNCGQIPGGFELGLSSTSVKWGVTKVEITATPSVIIFSGAANTTEQMKFNVDRKTLKGGYLTNRSWKCKIEEVDSSENLI